VPFESVCVGLFLNVWWQTVPEVVHNVSHCCHRSTEPRWQISFGDICKRIVRQTDRRAVHNTSHTYRGSKYIIYKIDKLHLTSRLIQIIPVRFYFFISSYRRTVIHRP